MHPFSPMKSLASLCNRQPRNWSRLGLALLGETYPLTHDLELLFNLLKERGVAASAFLALIEYTPYAVQFRYEAIGVDKAPLDRREGLCLVESLLAQVQSQFNGVE